MVPVISYGGLKVSHHPADGSNIIELLNDLQDIHGYLPYEELISISVDYDIPLSKIYGIITFYNHYSTDPPSEYTIHICTGTACHVKNSDKFEMELINQLSDSPDDFYQIKKVACLGCCALSPVIQINGRIHGKLNISALKQLTDKMRIEYD